MKKLFLTVIVLAAVIGGYFGLEAGKTAFYLNAADDNSYNQLLVLKKALQQEGARVILSRSGKHKSGEYTLYLTDNVNNLPEVVNSEVINLLWLSKHPNREKPELLRPYDVVVIKNIPDFNHLKAVNVRTAYIPGTVDITSTTNDKNNGNVMFYGDYEGFSLALYLAGPVDVPIHVYGKGFEKVWNLEEIKGDKPSDADFSDYALVLVDQSDDEVSHEVVNDRILEVIAKGGLPFVRHNNGIVRMFGNAVPMYLNSEMFEPELKRLLSNPEELRQRKEDIRYFSQQWSSRSQARKFMEIFELMSLKRR